MLYFLLSLCVATAFSAELESQAKLLASKTVENKFIVENRDLTVKYCIYNVGTRYVLIILKLDCFCLEIFDHVYQLTNYVELI